MGLVNIDHEPILETTGSLSVVWKRQWASLVPSWPRLKGPASQESGVSCWGIIISVKRRWEETKFRIDDVVFLGLGVIWRVIVARKHGIAVAWVWKTEEAFHHTHSHSHWCSLNKLVVKLWVYLHIMSLPCSNDVELFSWKQHDMEASKASLWQTKAEMQFVVFGETKDRQCIKALVKFNLVLHPLQPTCGYTFQK